MYERFTYKILKEVQQEQEELRIKIPFAKDIHLLKGPIKITKSIELRNRIGIAPIEGVIPYLMITF